MPGGGYMRSHILGNIGQWTGAAVASIPIDVPPGPNGLVPNLALSYSSNVIEEVTYRGGQDETEYEDYQLVSASPYGYGWSLSGVPEIRRVSKVDAWGDSDNGGFEISINGETSRLIHPHAHPTRMVPDDTLKFYQTYPQRFMYVARTTNYEVAGRCGYTTDELFQESRWEVITRDGTHYEFGGPDNVKLKTPSCDPDNPDDYAAVQLMIRQESSGVDRATVPARWFVTKITDVHGNVLRFKYRKEQAVDPDDAGQMYDTAVTLREITYGGPDVATHRAKIVVVEQAVPRKDCKIQLPTPAALWACGDDPEDVPGYRTEHLIDRIEVKIKANENYPTPPAASDAWVDLRVYNLDYTYHDRPDPPTQHQFYRALLDSVTVANGNMPDPTMTATGTPGTPMPTAEPPSFQLPPYSFEYYTEDEPTPTGTIGTPTPVTNYSDNTNWVPLKSFDNGMGGKVTYGYEPEGTDTPVKCWHKEGEDDPEDKNHPRKPVQWRQVFDDGELVSTNEYIYEDPVCTERFSSEVGGVHNGWYEFLGYGTVKDTLTDYTLPTAQVVEHITTDYYRCTDEANDCAYSMTPTPSVTPAPEPHPNKGSIKKRQVRAGTAEPVELQEEQNYYVDTLNAEYIGFNPSPTKDVATLWGRLDTSVSRTFGLKDAYATPSSSRIDPEAPFHAVFGGYLRLKRSLQTLNSRARAIASTFR